MLCRNNEPVFYYHSDHLGSASYITDDAADVVQQIAYLPYGEDWVDVRSNGFFGSAYKFNGKEKDNETGYSYYGARYYSDKLGIWLSVDPLADKYPSLSPYNYCANNPVMLVDPDGREADDPPYTYKYAGVIAGYILEKAGYFPLIKQGGYAMGNTDNAIHIKNNLNVVATNFQVNIGKAIGRIDNMDGSPQNAIRHTLWNALMVRDLDRKQATRASNSHETGWTMNADQRSFVYKISDNPETTSKNRDKTLLKADQVIDLLNNEIGRKIGLENPHADNKTLAGKVIEEYYRHGLYTAEDNGSGRINVVRTKLTKEQYNAAMKEISKKGNNGLNK